MLLVLLNNDVQQDPIKLTSTFFSSCFKGDLEINLNLIHRVYLHECRIYTGAVGLGDFGHEPRRQTFWEEAVAAVRRRRAVVQSLSCEEDKCIESVRKQTWNEQTGWDTNRSLTHGVAAADGEQQHGQSEAESLHDAVSAMMMMMMVLLFFFCLLWSTLSTMSYINPYIAEPDVKLSRISLRRFPPQLFKPLLVTWRSK